MDYIVQFVINDDEKIKEDIVYLEDGNNLGADFLEDFIKDVLVDKYEVDYIDLDIVHIETLIDYNVDVYKL